MSKQQFVSFIKPLHSRTKVDPDEVAFEDFSCRAFDQIASNTIAPGALLRTRGSILPVIEGMAA